MNQRALKKVKEVFTDAQAYRKKLYSDEDWDAYEGYWRGEYPAQDHILTVPILVSNAQRQKASIIGAEPRFEFSANGDPEMVPAARILT